MTEKEKKHVDPEQFEAQKQELLIFFEEEQQHFDVPDFDETIICENPFT